MTCGRYGRFAPVYDRFMAEVPYKTWARYIDRVLKKALPARDGEPPIVADLACGTGTMTLLLAKKGYDMLGADISPDMLAEAREKLAKAGRSDILFLQQDLRALDLYGTVDAAVCACDGLNYLLTEDDLGLAFGRVALFMSPGGVFIFDMNTAYKYKKYGSNTFAESVDGASYIWRNRYDEETRINEYTVDFFLHGDVTAENRFTETHSQRAYPVETVASLLAASGFRAVSVNDAYTDEPVKPESERVSFVAIKGVL